ncbi:MAG: hypothetical protein ACK46Q_15345 [Hyphomonas sp.]
MIRLFVITGLAASVALSLPLAAGPLLPVPFEVTDIGQMRDPTGLWSPAEVAEGGSDVQSSIRHAKFAVQGGTVTFSVLVGSWCGMTECPVRFRVTTDGDRAAQNFETTEYDMICQDFEGFTYDPEARLLHACAARIQLLS